MRPCERMVHTASRGAFSIHNPQFIIHHSPRRMKAMKGWMMDCAYRFGISLGVMA